MSDLAARYDSVWVTAGELLRAIEVLQHLSNTNEDRKQRIECLEKLFEGDAEKALVVGWRLDAMSIALALGRLSHWSPSQAAVGAISPVLVAAATQTLLFSLGEPRFDSIQFEKSVLATVVDCGLCLSSF